MSTEVVAILLNPWKFRMSLDLRSFQLRIDLGGGKEYQFNTVPSHAIMK
jgi:hypothetical protein